MHMSVMLPTPPSRVCMAEIRALKSAGELMGIRCKVILKCMAE